MNNTTKQFHPSEITEEEEEEEDKSTLLALDPKVQKERIRRIIDHQKSLYFSSSSSSSLSSSSAASSSSFPSSRRTSLLDLMRGGSTSLNRLFDMEHTRLSTHFNEYSGSPVIKPIGLWGSDEEEEEGSHRFSPWANVKAFKSAVVGGSLSNDGGFAEGGISPEFAAKKRRSRRRLRRTKTFRNLPGFFRLRLKRLRIIICGKKF